MMAVLSNRQRRKLKARLPKASRTHKVTTTAPKVCEPKEKPEDRDGLEWLIRKGRLKGSRIRAARFYRRLYRDAPLDDGARLKSNLDRSIGGGGGAGDPVALVQADAQFKLRLVRAVFGVITEADEAEAERQKAGLAWMRLLLDGVCGGGRTIREMCGGHQRKTEASEAVFMIALDLVALAQAQIEAAELGR